MPTTMTLKNIPNEVYERLKTAAAASRRSMNNEAIIYLEAALLPRAMTVSDRLERLRRLRAQLPPGKFKARDIDALKRAGRP